MASLPASDIARRLVALPTVNPPGEEADAQPYLQGLLEAAGLEVAVFEKEAGRPNLVTRLAGSGGKPSLILHGHVDVVGVDGQVWDHPPFGAVVEGGVLHGRGALDMKSGVAMMTHAILRAKVDRIRPSGDVVLALVADSETGGGVGLAHLLEDHPDVFAGARYAIGEFGGFPLHAFGRRFYRIGVSQKQYLHLRIRLSGTGGHGSRPGSDTVIGRLGEVLSRFDAGRMPYHRSAIARQVIETIADRVPQREADLLGGLLDADTFEEAVAELGDLGATFESLFRDTANATIVTAGAKFNVVPSQACIEVDARLLPGRSRAEAIDDILGMIGSHDAEVDVAASGPPAPDEFDAGLFDTLTATLVDLDPEAVTVPYLFNESPDGRLFAAHGVQHYGFLPMDLPPDFHLPDLIHGPNERVPVASIDFGAEALYRLLTRY